MIDVIDSGHRIGVYWAFSCAGFSWFAWLAVRRLIEDATRMRFAILAFATAWALLCGNNALFRFGVAEAASLSSWEAETIRAACVVSLGWLCWEFRARRSERPKEATS